MTDRPFGQFVTECAVRGWTIEARREKWGHLAPSPKGAWNACKDSIAAPLSNPSAATFASLEESRVISLVEGPYEVHSHVDMKSESGAVQRSDFTCKLTHLTDNSCSIIELTMK